MKQEWTHKGMAFGLVPVRLGVAGDGEPLVEVRHWSLEPLMDICEAMYGLLVSLRITIDPDYEPSYPFLVTGEIQQ